MTRIFDWAKQLLDSRPHSTQVSRRQRPQLALEPLEDRSMMANFNSVDVADLIADIDAANLTPEPDSIVLVAGRTYTLIDRDNSLNGWSGLPIIAAGEDLTIVGNGATIERSTGGDNLVFRLIHVAADASLSLENVTLQGGQAVGTGALGQGGAIFNLGTLSLRNVVVRNNGAYAYGGGIYSNGSLSVEGGVFEGNEVLGVRGRDATSSPRGGVRAATRGGPGLGGGLYVAGGPAVLADMSLVGNTAQGGRGGDGTPGVGNGGLGAGGGLYLASGHVQLSGVTLADNSARGGNRGNGNGGTGGNGNGGGLYAAAGTINIFDSSATGNSAQSGNGGQGTGGGLFIEANSSAGLNAFTTSHITNNTASTSAPNISGVFQTISNPNPLPGDFNNDDKVDAADYVVWRKNDGTNNALTNDNGLGTPIGAAHYSLWRANFGMTFPMPGAGGEASTGDTLTPSPVAGATTLTAAPMLHDTEFMMLGQRTHPPAGAAAAVVKTAQWTAAVDAAIGDSLLLLQVNCGGPVRAKDSAQSAGQGAKNSNSDSQWRDASQPAVTGLHEPLQIEV